MEILLNGEKEVLDKDYTLMELLQKFELSPDRINVSINGSIVQKEIFDSLVVKNGDSVDILFFMGGGQ